MVNLPKIDDDLWSQVVELNKFRLTDDGVKNYGSVSKINKYVGCPAAYRQRYIENIPEAKNANLIFGSGFHKAAEITNRRIMEKQEIPDLQEVSDITMETYEKLISEDGSIDFSKSNTTEEKERAELLDACRMYVLGEGGAKERIKRPIHGVEFKIRGVIDLIAAEVLSLDEIQKRVADGDIGYSLPILGYIDVIEGNEADVEVTDYKTSGKDYKQERADTDPQLSIYSALTDIPRVRFDVCRRATKTLPPRWQKEFPLRSTREPNQFKFYIQYVFKIVEQISKGNFPELAYFNRASGDWRCNPKWCGYYHNCIGAAENQWNLRRG